MKKNLPSDITSYDILKTIAIILMIIDHLGYYFFSEDYWLRVIGRLCVPIWFFLIGYAHSRDVGLKLWIGSLILVLANIPAGLFIFPLNILPTMIFIRLVIDQYMMRSMRDFNAFWAMAFIIALLAFPSNFVSEYGTLGLIMAIYGYLVRRKEELKETHPQYLSGFFTFSLLSFLVIQQIGFGFNESQFMVMCIGIMLVMLLLYFFSPATYPKLTKCLPGFLVKTIQFTGRRTLEIYVLHLLIFKFLAPIYNPDVYTFFDWSFIIKDAI